MPSLPGNNKIAAEASLESSLQEAESDTARSLSALGPKERKFSENLEAALTMDDYAASLPGMQEVEPEDLDIKGTDEIQSEADDQALNFPPEKPSSDSKPDQKRLPRESSFGKWKVIKRAVNVKRAFKQLAAQSTAEQYTGEVAAVTQTLAARMTEHFDEERIFGKVKEEEADEEPEVELDGIRQLVAVVRHVFANIEFDPVGSPWQLWKVGMIVAQIWAILDIPFQASFYGPVFIPWYQYIVAITECLFLIDTFVTKFTKSIDPNKVSDAPSLFYGMTGYSSRWNVFCELVSGIPLNTLVWQLYGDLGPDRMGPYKRGGVTAMSLRWLSGIFRACGTVRFRNINTLEHAIRSRVMTIMTRLLRLMMAYILISHWVSCGFFGLARFVSFDDGCWVARKGLVDEDVPEQFVKSAMFGFSLTSTMGWGDFATSELNMVESIYTLLITVVGGAWFAFLMAHLLDLVATLQYSDAQHFQQVNDLKLFLETKSVPVALQNRIMAHSEMIWFRHRGLDEAAVLNRLSVPLRLELKLHLCREIVASIPAFEGAGPNFLTELVMAVKAELLAPGDMLTKEGEMGDCMFFIVNGQIEIFKMQELELGVDESYELDVPLQKKRVLTTLSEGSYFGEIALLQEGTGLRSASARALTYCDVFRLDKADFHSVTAKFPGQKKRLLEIAKMRVERDRRASDLGPDNSKPLPTLTDEDPTQKKPPGKRNSSSMIIRGKINDGLDNLVDAAPSSLEQGSKDPVPVGHQARSRTASIAATGDSLIMMQAPPWAKHMHQTMLDRTRSIQEDLERLEKTVKVLQSTTTTTSSTTVHTTILAPSETVPGAAAPTNSPAKPPLGVAKAATRESATSPDFESKEMPAKSPKTSPRPNSVM